MELPSFRQPLVRRVIYSLTSAGRHLMAGEVALGVAADQVYTRVTGAALKAARNHFENVVKPAYWKSYARQIDEGVIDNPFVDGGGAADNLGLMRAGKAPFGPDGLRVVLHHRVPLSWGGSNTFDNLFPMTQTFRNVFSGLLHTPPF